jgi:ABC-type Fe3+/spermidine/putrescine transport system ATPase subunit
MAALKPKLALRGIGRRYGDADAVRDITLALSAGEFVSLLGPSGCGKTTTLRMIAGFIKPTTGTIELDGKILSSPDISTPPERRNMSMIFQSYAVWPHMTVADNVAFGLKLRRLPTSTIREKVDRMLDTVRLRSLADRYPGELSGGQQQRVALARAMVVEPGVLLLDEPLSNLDASLREEMRFEIRRLHDAFHITTVYVTHDQAEAMVTSDRIAVMNHGRVEQVDTPYAIYNQPATRFVAGFIGRTNLLEGECENGTFRCDGLVIAPLQAANGPCALSIRPQTIALSVAPPGASGERPVLEAVIQERSYLGEFWDYVIAPVGAARSLRVSTPAASVFDLGASVWAAIDPKQIVLLR